MAFAVLNLLAGIALSIPTAVLMLNARGDTRVIFGALICLVWIAISLGGFFSLLRSYRRTR